MIKISMGTFQILSLKKNPAFYFILDTNVNVNVGNV